MNPHGFPHTPLKRTRLPVPPPALNLDYLPGGGGVVGGTRTGVGGAWGALIGTRLVTLDILDRLESNVKKSEVKAKRQAKTVVTFFMKLDPGGGVIKESPLPPNTDRPAPRPVCSSTTIIIKKQAMI